MEEPHKEMLTTWTSSNSSHKHQIWMTLHNQRSERWQHQPNLKKMMMKVGVMQELSWIEIVEIIIEIVKI